MGNMTLNYETLIKVTRSLSKSKDPEKIIRMTVESVRSALGLKGCALFLINKQSKELEVAASTGLSDDYLNKGTVSALRSIAASLEDGPVAVSDVGDDPRIQYPEAARKEGIASILSVPILIGDNAIGALRVYSAEKWEFTLDDVNFVQAPAQIVGILVEMSRLHKGQSEYIDVLATMCESPALCLWPTGCMLIWTFGPGVAGDPVAGRPAGRIRGFDCRRRGDHLPAGPAGHRNAAPPGPGHEQAARHVRQHDRRAQLHPQRPGQPARNARRCSVHRRGGPGRDADRPGALGRLPAAR